MIQKVQAIFENGVLRPLGKLSLEEHQRVEISIHSILPTKVDGEKRSLGDPLEGLRVATGIADLSENFDDYRFGRRQP
jgi:predicted DNA-binding antitoxin AbrB/MazE fold protein